MAVPTDISDISSTESSNSPSGSESIGVSMDNYLRAAYAITKQQAIKGADIASGSTITIPTIGAYFVVTGTTTIGAINNSFNGRISVLKFDAALTLTNSASLILFGGDLTTAAGDILTVVNESAGVYRAINYIDASNAGSYATLAGTETLTNKTMVAANNTITTAASGTLTQVELNAVIAEIAAEIAVTTANIALRATIASPTFTGVPVVPTASPDDNSTQIASTAYVDEATNIDTWQIAGVMPTAVGLINGATDVFIGATLNLATITSDSAGHYNFTFTTPLDDTNYTIMGTASLGSGISSMISDTAGKTVNGFSVYSLAGTTPTDCATFSVLVFFGKV